MNIIDTMKQVLEALEHNAGEFRVEGAKNILREALAQPEQDPVAYRTVNNVGAYVYHSADRLPNEYGLRGEALYLHPAPIPEGWKFITEPDALGMGRIIVNGKYYGLPMEVIDWLAAVPKQEDV